MLITPAEFERDMQNLSAESERDCEAPHVAADKLMCDVLRQFGYEKGVEIFENMGKWYS